jgi:peptidyl-prolyl cis-trans isomerase C
MKKKLFLAARAPLLAVAIAAMAITPLAAQAQNVATVNGKPVPKARVEALMQQATRQGQPRTPELEVQVRDEVVLREMFAQEAIKRGLSTTENYKAQIEMARQGILIRELFNDYQKKNPVTEADIKAEYEQYKKQAGGNEYRARHILVEKEEEAKALITQLQGGAKFEDLAKKNSKDPGSGANGGDLDWANPTSYVAPFSEALVKLKKGETTSAPVKSDFGYHVIRLDDIRAAQPQSLEEMTPQITQHLAQLKLTQFREEVRTKAKTDYKFTPAPAAN